jgi:hypothetical protein
MNNEMKIVAFSLTTFMVQPSERLNSIEGWPIFKMVKWHLSTTYFRKGISTPFESLNSYPMLQITL